MPEAETKGTLTGLSIAIAAMAALLLLAVVSSAAPSDPSAENPAAVSDETDFPLLAEVQLRIRVFLEGFLDGGSPPAPTSTDPPPPAVGLAKFNVAKSTTGEPMETEGEPTDLLVTTDRPLTANEKIMLRVTGTNGDDDPVGRYRLSPRTIDGPTTGTRTMATFSRPDDRWHEPMQKAMVQAHVITRISSPTFTASSRMIEIATEDDDPLTIRASTPLHSIAPGGSTTLTLTFNTLLRTEIEVRGTGLETVTTVKPADEQTFKVALSVREDTPEGTMRITVRAAVPETESEIEERIAMRIATFPALRRTSIGLRIYELPLAEKTDKYRLTMTLNRALLSEERVLFEVIPSPGGLPEDYTLSPLLIQGPTSGPQAELAIVFTAVDDDQHEEKETFTVRATVNEIHYRGSPPRAVVIDKELLLQPLTITNDDALTIEASPPDEIPEGESRTVAVTLNTVLAATVSVSGAGIESATVAKPAGVRTVDVVLRTVAGRYGTHDAAIRADVSATGARADREFTIEIPAPPLTVTPVLLQADAVIAEGDQHRLPLSLSRSLLSSERITFEAVGGAGATPQDYDLSPQLIEGPPDEASSPGETSDLLAVSVFTAVDDGQHEADEVFTVRARAVTSRASTPQAVFDEEVARITITDNDELTIEASLPNEITEGESRTVAVTLNTLLEVAVRISGNAGIEPGSTTKPAGTRTVDIELRTVAGRRDTQSVTISAEVLETGAQAEFMRYVEINQALPAPLTMQLSAGDTVIAEGESQTLTLATNRPLLAGETVALEVAGAAAVPSESYSVLPQAVEGPSTSTQTVFAFSVPQDGLHEATAQTFAINPAYRAGGSTTAQRGNTVVIALEDDDPLTIEASLPDEITEGESRTVAVTLNTLLEAAVRISGNAGIEPGSATKPAGVRTVDIELRTVAGRRDTQSVTISAEVPETGAQAEFMSYVEINPAAPVAPAPPALPDLQLSAAPTVISEGESAALTLTVNRALEADESAGVQPAEGRQLLEAERLVEGPAASTQATTVFSAPDDGLHGKTRTLLFRPILIHEVLLGAPAPGDEMDRAGIMEETTMVGTVPLLWRWWQTALFEGVEVTITDDDALTIEAPGFVTVTAGESRTISVSLNTMLAADVSVSGTGIEPGSAAKPADTRAVDVELRAIAGRRSTQVVTISAEVPATGAQAEIEMYVQINPAAPAAPAPLTMQWSEDETEIGEGTSQTLTLTTGRALRAGETITLEVAGEDGPAPGNYDVSPRAIEGPTDGAQTAFVFSAPQDELYEATTQVFLVQPVYQAQPGATTQRGVAAQVAVIDDGDPLRLRSSLFASRRSSRFWNTVHYPDAGNTRQRNVRLALNTSLEVQVSLPQTAALGEFSVTKPAGDSVWEEFDLSARLRDGVILPRTSEAVIRFYIPGDWRRWRWSFGVRTDGGFGPLESGGISTTPGGTFTPITAQWSEDAVIGEGESHVLTLMLSRPLTAGESVRFETAGEDGAAPGEHWLSLLSLRGPLDATQMDVTFSTWEDDLHEPRQRFLITANVVRAASLPGVVFSSDPVSVTVEDDDALMIDAPDPFAVYPGDPIHLTLTLNTEEEAEVSVSGTGFDPAAATKLAGERTVRLPLEHDGTSASSERITIHARVSATDAEADAEITVLSLPPPPAMQLTGGGAVIAEGGSHPLTLTADRRLLENSETFVLEATAGDGGAAPGNYAVSPQVVIGPTTAAQTAFVFSAPQDNLHEATTQVFLVRPAYGLHSRATPTRGVAARITVIDDGDPLAVHLPGCVRGAGYHLTNSGCIGKCVTKGMEYRYPLILNTKLAVHLSMPRTQEIEEFSAFKPAGTNTMELVVKLRDDWAMPRWMYRLPPAQVNFYVPATGAWMTRTFYVMTDGGRGPLEAGGTPPGIASAALTPITAQLSGDAAVGAGDSHALSLSLSRALTTGESVRFEVAGEDGTTPGAHRLSLLSLRGPLDDTRFEPVFLAPGDDDDNLHELRKFLVHADVVKNRPPPGVVFSSTSVAITVEDDPLVIETVGMPAQAGIEAPTTASVSLNTYLRAEVTIRGEGLETAIAVKPAGVRTVNVALSVSADAEPGTVRVTVSAFVPATGGRAEETFAIEIPGPVALTLTPVSLTTETFIAEGGRSEFPLTLSRALRSSEWITFEVVGGAGASSSDYDLSPQRAAVAGETPDPLRVTPVFSALDDGRHEAPETFTVRAQAVTQRASPPAEVLFDEEVARFTVTDDDALTIETPSSAEIDFGAEETVSVTLNTLLEAEVSVSGSDIESAAVTKLAGTRTVEVALRLHDSVGSTGSVTVQASVAKTGAQASAAFGFRVRRLALELSGGGVVLQEDETVELVLKTGRRLRADESLGLYSTEGSYEVILESGEVLTYFDVRRQMVQGPTTDTEIRFTFAPWPGDDGSHEPTTRNLRLQMSAYKWINRRDQRILESNWIGLTIEDSDPLTVEVTGTSVRTITGERADVHIALNTGLRVELEMEVSGRDSLITGIKLESYRREDVMTMHINGLPPLPPGIHPVEIRATAPQTQATARTTFNLHVAERPPITVRLSGDAVITEGDNHPLSLELSRPLLRSESVVFEITDGNGGILWDYRWREGQNYQDGSRYRRLRLTGDYVWTQAYIQGVAEDGQLSQKWQWASSELPKFSSLLFAGPTVDRQDEIKFSARQNGWHEATEVFLMRPVYRVNQIETQRGDAARITIEDNDPLTTRSVGIRDSHLGFSIVLNTYLETEVSVSGEGITAASAVKPARTTYAELPLRYADDASPGTARATIRMRVPETGAEATTEVSVLIPESPPPMQWLRGDTVVKEGESQTLTLMTGRPLRAGETITFGITDEAGREFSRLSGVTLSPQVIEGPITSTQTTIVFSVQQNSEHDVTTRVFLVHPVYRLEQAAQHGAAARVTIVDDGDPAAINYFKKVGLRIGKGCQSRGRYYVSDFRLNSRCHARYLTQGKEYRYSVFLNMWWLEAHLSMPQTEAIEGFSAIKPAGATRLDYLVVKLRDDWVMPRGERELKAQVRIYVPATGAWATKTFYVRTNGGEGILVWGEIPRGRPVSTFTPITAQLSEDAVIRGGESHALSLALSRPLATGESVRFEVTGEGGAPPDAHRLSLLYLRGPLDDTRFETVFWAPGDGDDNNLHESSQKFLIQADVVRNLSPPGVVFSSTSVAITVEDDPLVIETVGMPAQAGIEAPTTASVSLNTYLRAEVTIRGAGLETATAVKPAGVRTMDVALTVSADAEPGTVRVTVSAFVPATEARAEKALAIEIPGPVALTLTPVSLSVETIIAEGDRSGFPLTLSRALRSSEWIIFEVVGGAGATSSDYDLSPQWIEGPATGYPATNDDTSGPLRVTPVFSALDDGLHEAPEAFAVRAQAVTGHASTPTGVMFGTATGSRASASASAPSSTTVLFDEEVARFTVTDNDALTISAPLPNEIIQGESRNVAVTLNTLLEADISILGTGIRSENVTKPAGTRTVNIPLRAFAGQRSARIVTISAEVAETGARAEAAMQVRINPAPVLPAMQWLGGDAVIGEGTSQTLTLATGRALLVDETIRLEVTGEDGGPVPAHYSVSPQAVEGPTDSTHTAFVFSSPQDDLHETTTQVFLVRPVYQAYPEAAMQRGVAARVTVVDDGDSLQVSTSTWPGERGRLSYSRIRGNIIRQRDVRIFLNTVLEAHVSMSQTAALQELSVLNPAIGVNQWRHSPQARRRFNLAVKLREGVILPRLWSEGVIRVYIPATEQWGSLKFDVRTGGGRVPVENEGTPTTPGGTFAPITAQLSEDAVIGEGETHPLSLALSRPLTAGESVHFEVTSENGPLPGKYWLSLLSLQGPTDGTHTTLAFSALQDDLHEATTQVFLVQPVYRAYPGAAAQRGAAARITVIDDGDDLWLYSVICSSPIHGYCRSEPYWLSGITAINYIYFGPNTREYDLLLFLGTWLEVHLSVPQTEAIQGTSLIKPAGQSAWGQRVNLVFRQRDDVISPRWSKVLVRAYVPATEKWYTWTLNVEMNNEGWPPENGRTSGTPDDAFKPITAQWSEDAVIGEGLHTLSLALSRPLEAGESVRFEVTDENAGAPSDEYWLSLLSLRGPLRTPQVEVAFSTPDDDLHEVPQRFLVTANVVRDSLSPSVIFSSEPVAITAEDDSLAVDAPDPFLAYLAGPVLLPLTLNTELAAEVSVTGSGFDAVSATKPAGTRVLNLPLEHDGTSTWQEGITIRAQVPATGAEASAEITVRSLPPPPTMQLTGGDVVIAEGESHPLTLVTDRSLLENGETLVLEAAGGAGAAPGNHAVSPQVVKGPTAGLQTAFVFSAPQDGLHEATTQVFQIRPAYRTHSRATPTRGVATRITVIDDGDPLTVKLPGCERRHGYHLTKLSCKRYLGDGILVHGVQYRYLLILNTFLEAHLSMPQTQQIEEFSAIKPAGTNTVELVVKLRDDWVRPSRVSRLSAQVNLHVPATGASAVKAFYLDVGGSGTYEEGRPPPNHPAATLTPITAQLSGDAAIREGDSHALSLVLSRPLATGESVRFEITGEDGAASGVHRLSLLSLRGPLDGTRFETIFLAPGSGDDDDLHESLQEFLIRAEVIRNHSSSSVVFRESLSVRQVQMARNDSSPVVVFSSASVAITVEDDPLVIETVGMPAQAGIEVPPTVLVSLNTHLRAEVTIRGAGFETATVIKSAGVRTVDVALSVSEGAQPGTTRVTVSAFVPGTGGRVEETLAIEIPDPAALTPVSLTPVSLTTETFIAEGGRSEFPLTLSRALRSSEWITFEVIGGAGATSSDYDLLPQRAAVAGETPDPLRVTPVFSALDDGRHEASETFAVRARAHTDARRVSTPTRVVFDVSAQSSASTPVSALSGATVLFDEEVARFTVTDGDALTIEIPPSIEIDPGERKTVAVTLNTLLEAEVSVTGPGVYPATVTKMAGTRAVNVVLRVRSGASDPSSVTVQASVAQTNARTSVVFNLRVPRLVLELSGDGTVLQENEGIELVLKTGRLLRAGENMGLYVRGYYKVTLESGRVITHNTPRADQRIQGPTADAEIRFRFEPWPGDDDLHEARRDFRLQTYVYRLQTYAYRGGTPRQGTSRQIASRSNEINITIEDSDPLVVEVPSTLIQATVGDEVSVLVTLNTYLETELEMEIAGRDSLITGLKQPYNRSATMHINELPPGIYPVEIRATVPRTQATARTTFSLHIMERPPITLRLAEDAVITEGDVHPLSLELSRPLSINESVTLEITDGNGAVLEDYRWSEQWNYRDDRYRRLVLVNGRGAIQAHIQGAAGDGRLSQKWRWDSSQRPRFSSLLFAGPSAGRQERIQFSTMRDDRYEPTQVFLMRPVYRGKEAATQYGEAARITLEDDDPLTVGAEIHSSHLGFSVRLNTNLEAEVSVSGEGIVAASAVGLAEWPYTLLPLRYTDDASPGATRATIRARVLETGVEATTEVSVEIPESPPTMQWSGGDSVVEEGGSQALTLVTSRLLRAGETITFGTTTEEGGNVFLPRATLTPQTIEGPTTDTETTIVFSANQNSDHDLTTRTFLVHPVYRLAQAAQRGAAARVAIIDDDPLTMRLSFPGCEARSKFYLLDEPITGRIGVRGCYFKYFRKGKEYLYTPGLNVWEHEAHMTMPQTEALEGFSAIKPRRTRSLDYLVLKLRDDWVMPREIRRLKAKVSFYVPATGASVMRTFYVRTYGGQGAFATSEVTPDRPPISKLSPMTAQLSADAVIGKGESHALSLALSRPLARGESVRFEVTGEGGVPFGANRLSLMSLRGPMGSTQFETIFLAAGDNDDLYQAPQKFLIKANVAWNLSLSVVTFSSTAVAVTVEDSDPLVIEVPDPIVVYPEGPTPVSFTLNTESEVEVSVTGVGIYPVTATKPAGTRTVELSLRRNGALSGRITVHARVPGTDDEATIEVSVLDPAPPPTMRLLGGGAVINEGESHALRLVTNRLLRAGETIELEVTGEDGPVPRNYRLSPQTVEGPTINRRTGLVFSAPHDNLRETPTRVFLVRPTYRVRQAVQPGEAARITVAGVDDSLTITLPGCQRDYGYHLTKSGCSAKCVTKGKQYRFPITLTTLLEVHLSMRRTEAVEEFSVVKPAGTNTVELVIKLRDDWVMPRWVHRLRAQVKFYMPSTGAWATKTFYVITDGGRGPFESGGTSPDRPASTLTPITAQLSGDAAIRAGGSHALSLTLSRPLATGESVRFEVTGEGGAPPGAHRLSLLSLRGPLDGTRFETIFRAPNSRDLRGSSRRFLIKANVVRNHSSPSVVFSSESVAITVRR